MQLNAGVGQPSNSIDMMAGSNMGSPFSRPESLLATFLSFLKPSLPLLLVTQIKGYEISVVTYVILWIPTDS